VVPRPLRIEFFRILLTPTTLPVGATLSVLIRTAGDALVASRACAVE